MSSTADAIYARLMEIMNEKGGAPVPQRRRDASVALSLNGSFKIALCDLKNISEQDGGARHLDDLSASLKCFGDPEL